MLLVSCSRWKEPAESVDKVPAIFPDYVDVTIPSRIAPLNFMVKGARHVQVVFCNEKGMELRADGDDAVQLDETEWQQLTADGGVLKVDVSVWDDAHPDGAKYRTFDVCVSKDEVDPWIMYRLLPPGYEGWMKMGIYQRELASFDELTVMDNEEDHTRCMNCHSTLQNDPEYFTFHQRGKDGFTSIRRKGKTQRIDLKALSGGRHGSHNAWHPSGRYIAFSSNDTKQIFYGKSQDKIEVFDLWSDLFIYDVEGNRVLQDNRFIGEQQLETYPSFSHDGKWLYFSLAKPVHMPEEYEELHYDLVRVPFDVASGTLGEVDTLYSSYQRGGTALMPRMSPDGHFLLYTVSESGAFNLYHKESDFEMMNLEDGSLVDCSPINSADAESFHSWSSNGRWMLFSSKQVDGRYTRLFIAHWDGRVWSKPFLLPQRDPKQNTMLMMAYNVGEFLKKKYE